jgi:hemoglobin-like flavoprotein
MTRCVRPNQAEVTVKGFLRVAIVTPEQTELVRQSFDAIWPVRLADQFYRRFFELAPDAQGLFRSDMERQYLKLMDMIAAIVGTLDKREMFQSSLAIRVASTHNSGRSQCISLRLATR